MHFQLRLRIKVIIFKPNFLRSCFFKYENLGDTKREFPDCFKRPLTGNPTECPIKNVTLCLANALQSVTFF